MALFLLEIFSLDCFIIYDAIFQMTDKNFVSSGCFLKIYIGTSMRDTEPIIAVRQNQVDQVGWGCLWAMLVVR